MEFQFVGLFWLSVSVHSSSISAVFVGVRAHTFYYKPQTHIYISFVAVNLCEFVVFESDIEQKTKKKKNIRIIQRWYCLLKSGFNSENCSRDIKYAHDKQSKSPNDIKPAKRLNRLFLYGSFFPKKKKTKLLLESEEIREPDTTPINL